MANNNEEISHNKTKNYIPDIELYLSSFGEKEEYAKRREILKDMTFEDFTELLLATCSLIRNGESNVPSSFDGEYSGAIFGGAVLKEDKMDCLEYTWNVAKKFIEDNTLTDEDSLIYTILTLSNGILLVHPFSEPNGNRYLFYL